MKKSIFVIFLLISIISCKTDDNVFLEENQTQYFKKLNKKEIEKNEKLSKFLYSFKSKQKNLFGKEVKNDYYDFYINTDFCIEIYNGSKVSYTFQIYEDSSSDIIQNIVMIDEGNEEYNAYLVSYDLSEVEKDMLTQQKDFSLQDKVKFSWIDGSKVSDDIFSKNVYSSMCYEYTWVYESGHTCASGLHSIEDGAICNYWGTTEMATSGGYVPQLIPVECFSGGGYSTSGTFVNTTPGTSGPIPHGGSYGGGTTVVTTCIECFVLELDDEDEDDCNTSKDDLKKVFPNMSDSNAELLAYLINEKGADFGIDSKEDLWHFLSQTGHETGGFTTLNVTESTYWTTASKLAATYSKFTMDSTEAATNPNRYYAPDYLQNSSGVANIAMCCNHGNGDVESGDGYKYRGRGIIQLTWKGNYSAFKDWYNSQYEDQIDPVGDPDIISSNDTLGIISGMWYYKTKIVDNITIDSTTTVKKVTKKINSALKHLTDRENKFEKAKDSINCL